MEQPPAQEEEDFVDEDKFTTVTVEAMGEPGADIAELEDDDKPTTHSASTEKTNGKAEMRKKNPWSKDGKSAPKKKRKFRYESKAERAATRQKQKSKNHAAKVRRMGE